LDSYADSLLNSELPFDAWIVALTWLVLFFSNHWIARSAREANQSQKLVAVEDWSFLRRSSEPEYILAQFLFAGMVFSFGVFLGGPAFVFFAGGLLVAIACTLSLNVQALLSARSMADPDAAIGTLTLSNAFAFRQAAYRAGGGAIACILMGMAIAHLALLGGGLLLAATARGYLRRARNARAPS